jgi:quinol monooxygenase YgiN
MSLRVVARIPAKADKVEEVKALLEGLIEPTRKEAGCIVYELLQNTGEPTDFTFVEDWKSAADLEAHLKTPHLIHALSLFPDLLDGEADIRTYNLVR